MQSSRKAVEGLETTIGDFQTSVTSQMQTIYDTTTSISEATDQVYRRVSEFKQNMVKSEEIQLAHENVVRIDQVLKEQFGDYARIRKTIIGVVRDFDINLVRNKTIKDLSEELWLTSSRYWLSYALIAVSAWVNNFPEVAANALSECARRDKVKASLFFTLLNLRFGRNDTARHWFCHYMRMLDPNFLQREAAVMIEAYLAGIFGRDNALQSQVDKTIESWIAVINEDVSVSEDLVQAYANYIQNMSPGAQFTYESIRQFCENFDQLESVFRDVSKYQKVLELVDSLDVENFSLDADDYKDRIDNIMTDLISNYDRDEEELKNQQEYYNLVIQNDGSVNIAEAQFEEMLRLKGEGFNIGRQMIGWVLYDDETTDIHVRKFGLAHTKDWMKSALDRFSDNVQANFPTGYKLKIDGWEGLSDGNDHTMQEKALRDYFDSNKLSMIYLTVPNIAAAIIAIICVGMCFVSPFALIGVALAAGFLGFNIFRETKKFPERVNQAVNNLHATMREISEFKQFCNEANRAKNEIAERLEYGFFS